MLMWGAFAALLDPSPSHLMLGLAVVLAALLIAAAVALPAPVATTAPALRAAARRGRVGVLPRLRDPDAAGRPRPRAPSPHPAAV